MDRRYGLAALTAVLIVIWWGCPAKSWEVVYTGETFPSDQSLAPLAWYGENLSASYSASGQFHLVDPWQDRAAGFSRESVAIMGGTPVTVESRVRIVEAVSTVSFAGGVTLSVNTWGTGAACASVEFWKDRIGTRYSDGLLRTYACDMTVFRTVTLALREDNVFFVCLDGVQVFSGPARMGGQNGIEVASYPAGNVSESVWDYVAYSKESLPVPEPSSLLALSAGLAGMAGAMRRRLR